MVRRLKKEVLSQLPSKMRQRVPLPLDPTQVPPPPASALARLLLLSVPLGVCVCEGVQRLPTYLIVGAVEVWAD